MKRILSVVLCLAALSFTTEWQPSFETAKQIARDKHELILLNFSGSDWCGPCMRLRKEILDNGVFTEMADSSLVLVNADFPRNKKNQLSAKATKENEALADKYNPEGKFPFTLLLDANGKIIKSWDGYPDESVQKFTDEVKDICDTHK
jgi:thioredoxin-related protein